MKSLNSVPNIFILSLLFISGLMNSCGIYSFTGANVNADIKTIAIQQFDNSASIVVPNLIQTFSEALRDKFLTQTSLILVKENGHVNISGRITDYQIVPINIQGDQTAGQNRLTISVMVRFENELNPDENWEQSFSNFADYPSSATLSSIEQELIREINDKITQDIFNKAFANW